ncbi:hypothetical protein BC835DRAFT_319019 [Cytidiella melzeri]|nr:hypothetical protein BC835DRAFT_319019 [Cytidiella melzeri]
MPLNDVLRRGLQPISSALTSNRILWYSLLSTLATTAAIANACRNYSTFYSVAVYLSRSGRSLLVLANFGFIIALMSGRILQRVFFGSLQPREVERLYDQTWMFVTESLLAFTIFRDDFDIPFVIMFGFLLFIKCFHWLMADRVESMDQVPYPGPPTLFHVRLHALFCILWLVDMIMLVIAIESTLSTGVGGAVLFANEYAILTAHALNSMARYVLSAYELRRARARGGENAPSWENKSMYVFYIELVTDFLKLATYSTFFLVVLSFYGLPLNIIRDVYLTARSFITRLRALVRYHNATRDMDRRYPNATEEELAAMSDRTCIICRDELIAAPNNQTNIQQEGQAPNNVPNANQPQDGPNVTPKKLPCGHIFHFQCLRSWLERQQSCPTCRRTVLETGQPTRNAAQQRGARQPGQQHNNAVPQAPPVPGQQQPPPNNGLGWLGRLLGVALQPPLVPGHPKYRLSSFGHHLPCEDGMGPAVYFMRGILKRATYLRVKKLQLSRRRLECTLSSPSRPNIRLPSLPPLRLSLILRLPHRQGRVTLPKRLLPPKFNLQMLNLMYLPMSPAHLALGKLPLSQLCAGSSLLTLRLHLGPLPLSLLKVHVRRHLPKLVAIAQMLRCVLRRLSKRHCPRPLRLFQCRNPRQPRPPRLRLLLAPRRKSSRGLRLSSH